jgi:hypothetical protein
MAQYPTVAIHPGEKHLADARRYAHKARAILDEECNWTTPEYACLEQLCLAVDALVRMQEMSNEILKVAK